MRKRKRLVVVTGEKYGEGIKPKDAWLYLAVYEVNRIDPEAGEIYAESYLVEGEFETFTPDEVTELPLDCLDQYLASYEDTTYERCTQMLKEVGKKFIF